MRYNLSTFDDHWEGCAKDNIKECNDSNAGKNVLISELSPLNERPLLHQLLNRKMSCKNCRNLFIN